MTPELISLSKEADSNGDQIIKFDDFLERFSKFSKQENSFARKLFGDSLDVVVENTLEFYRQYQPTRPLCSVSGPEEYVEKHRRDSRYVVTDISKEGKRDFNLPKNSNLKFYRIEERIDYTPGMMLKDVEYNAKIAYALANIVGSKDAYEIGAGNGVLALGLSILSPSNITTIESDSRFVELQRRLHSNLADRIKGSLVIKEPMIFSDYFEESKISPDSFLVCSRADWKLFDEAVSFGINSGLDMFVSRDFHSQPHMLAPIESSPAEAYKHVRKLIDGRSNKESKYKLTMTLKSQNQKSKDFHHSHFIEVLIQRAS